MMGFVKEEKFLCIAAVIVAEELKDVFDDKLGKSPGVTSL